MGAKEKSKKLGITGTSSAVFTINGKGNNNFTHIKEINAEEETNRCAARQRCH